MCAGRSCVIPKYAVRILEAVIPIACWGHELLLCSATINANESEYLAQASGQIFWEVGQRKTIRVNKVLCAPSPSY